MAVPKRRMSRSRTRHRRSNWTAGSADLVSIRVDGQILRVPRRLMRAYHEGRLGR